MSFTEQTLVEHLVDELDGGEQDIIMSQVAERAGITRSVAVSALRKLESAQLIETRSLGSNGTHIKLINEYFLDKIAKHRQR